MAAPITVHDWAQQVLFGTTLGDKLWAPPCSDQALGDPCIEPPSRPGRPQHLALGRGGGESLPSHHALADPRARGQLLHAFANHELQALELMALALLRFGDAPPAFRRGLVAALREEQQHLSLYLDRMAELGTEFGAHPLGGFFWRVMAPMPSPLDFVAHLALTFEQANLDFARTYARTLREAGDVQTAEILDQVHADEIGHVKLGRVWFERWREAGPSLFEAHCRALRAPITARRARGLGFDRPGRRAAGLPDDYVEQLAVYESSRGRPPVVHMFEPTAELELGTRGSYTPPAALQTMIADLETLPMFTASANDVVLVRRVPSLAFQQSLVAMGFRMPQWIAVGAGNDPVEPAAVGHPRMMALRPWGWGSRARARLAPLTALSEHSPPPATADAWLHAKTTWVERARSLTDEGEEPWLYGRRALDVVAHEHAEVVAALERIEAHGYRRAVIKAPYGTSGRNAQRV
ncbi:MAG: ferritin-like domain-containing protein, partial [Deltaproteobacteria bacterium]|nr:ferritin-like domain-containing protein [Deltaproteobacteria bacterium]